MSIYFVDNSKVPYVDVKTFFNELNGLFEINNLTFSRSSLSESQTIRYAGLRINFFWREDKITMDDAIALNITKETAETD